MECSYIVGKHEQNTYAEQEEAERSDAQAIQAANDPTSLLVLVFLPSF